MPQIYEVLKEEHREMKQMLSELTEGTGDGRLFKKMATSLRAHQDAEEKTIYQDLRQPEPTHDSVLEGIEEHHVANLILKELMQLDRRDERFMPKLMVLRENVEHHMKDEEKELFSGAKKAMDREWAEQTAVRFEKQEELLKKSLSSRAGASTRSGATASRSTGSTATTSRSRGTGIRSSK